VKAFVLEKQQPIETRPLKLVELPRPRPGPGEILVRVTACGICRTDLHIVEGDIPPHKLPVIPGHQIVGVVEEQGPGVKQPEIGARVGVPWLYDTCSVCRLCRSGKENLCKKALFTGYDRDGGFAQYTLVPAGSAYELPGRLDDVGVAPLLCGGVIGWRALCLSGAKSGEVLGLFGFGASAHIVLQLARARGIRVFVFTRSPEHMKVAEKLGAQWTGRAEDQPPEPLQSAIVFAPAGKLVPRVLSLLDRGGVCALAGIYMSPIPELDYAEHLYHERVLRSVANSTRQDVRDLLSEAERAGVVTEHRVFPFSELNEALLLLKQSKLKASGVLKIDV